jgi:ligand-binding sensor domain-containing protein/two-component sensor histidine kinase
VFVLFLLISQPVFSQQNIRFKHLSVEHGLSQSTVETIVQDRLGFMWFGTEDGLNRFDGYSFTIFKHDPDNPGSISSNNIWCLYVDRKGFLWAGTYAGGLNRFDPKTEVFTRYLNDPSDPSSISSNRIRAITEDEGGKLWIGTRDGGLNLFKSDLQQFQRFKSDQGNFDGSISNNIRHILPDSNNTLWLATNRGFSLYHPGGGDLTHFRAGQDDSNSLCNDNVRHISKDRSGIYWISTAGGLCRFDPKAGQFKNYYSNPADPKTIAIDNIRKVYEDRRGRLWIATTKGGLCYLNREEDIFYSYVFDQTNPYSLSNNSVRVIYEDAGGLLWLGTFGGGINTYDPKKQRFYHFRHDPRNSNSLSDPIIWAITQGPDGDIWFGTNSSSFDRYNQNTSRYIHYHGDPNDPLKKAYHYIRSLQWDKTGKLWIGSRYGVDCFDPTDNSYIHLRHQPGDPNSLCNNNLRTIFQDSFGDMWFCTWGGGLDHYDRTTGTFTNFNHQPNNSNSISHDNVISIFQDSEGVFWVATSNGLNRLDFLMKSADSTRLDLLQVRISRYYNEPSNPQSLSNSYILSIHEAQNGDLWFGTMQGLSCLRKKDRSRLKFTRYFMKDGLPNDVVYGILEDSHGNLWLSTNYGLSRFDPDTETFKNFDVRDGLHSNEFNSGAYTQTNRGTFIFGGVNGASEFHPDSLLDNPYIAPVVLTGFNIFDKPARLTQSISSLEEIILSYKDNYFSFEFAALDFSVPDRNRYAYMLEGLDRVWTNSGSRRFAGYTHIDAGEYIFKVRGTNGDGVWNMGGASIKVIITPPFWKTWWFIVLMILTIGGGIILVITYRIRQLLKFERLRGKIAADLHDDIGAGLTEISIMGEVIIQRLPDSSKQLISSEIKNIGTTSRNLINSMTDIVWLVNPRSDSLYDLISRLGDSYKETLTSSGFQFKTQNLESLKNMRLSMEYRQQLLLIFKEAINNSLKYSQGSEMLLKATLRGKRLKMQLSDDGVGFDSSKEFPGNGLNNMKNRANQIGGSLKINSSIDAGTSIEFEGNIT